MDSASWHAVLDGLAAVTSITCFNDVSNLGGPFAGRQEEVDLSNTSLREKEAVVVVSRLLTRSQWTLKALDLRCSFPALLLTTNHHFYDSPQSSPLP